MQKRVLIVDDNPDGLEALSDLFRLWGHEVDVADDGKRALSVAFTRHPDIVVTDLGLPDGDAMEVIHRIKAEHEQTVVIAFSGWHHLEAAARAAGADAFVPKPDIDVLERLVAHPGASEAPTIVLKKNA